MGSILAPKAPKAPPPVTTSNEEAKRKAQQERMNQTRLRGLSGNILTSETSAQPAGQVATKQLLGG